MEKSKLIRDKIPEIIMDKGGEPEIYIAETIEYRKRLFEKLLEESDEVLLAQTDEEIKEEIADVYEVLDAILEEYGFSEQDIQKIKTKKREERGGFKERIILKY